MRRFFILIVFIAAVLPITAQEDARPVENASTLAEEKPARPDLPTFFIVGDSTVNTVTPGSQSVGWGQRIAPFFDSSKINVVNRAIGGRSSRTFFTEGRWARVLADLKQGDFVIIQFGHNDVGQVGEGKLRRSSLPGTGPETAGDPRENTAPEIVHTFGWYLARFTDEARARGATVILCSPIPRKNKWQQSRDWPDYATWTEQVAREHNAHFIDLTMVIARAYAPLDPPALEKFFVGSGHTTDTGARFNAARVISALKSLPGNPLDQYLSPEGQSIPADIFSAPSAPPR
ncbi:MAG: rhamnogalacturonan acetylesterase [Nibricoccus sp.]